MSLVVRLAAVIDVGGRRLRAVGEISQQVKIFPSSCLAKNLLRGKVALNFRPRAAGGMAGTIVSTLRLSKIEIKARDWCKLFESPL